MATVIYLEGTFEYHAIVFVRIQFPTKIIKLSACNVYGTYISESI